MAVFFDCMAGPSPIPLRDPPRIAAIDVGTFDAKDGRDACAEGQWRLQLHLSPTVITADGAELQLGSGCATIWPPATALTFRFEERLIHACSHFTLSGPTPGSAAQPIIRDLGARFRMLHGSFIEAVTWSRPCPARARARLWDLLWEISATPGKLPEPIPLLTRAQLHIDRRLRDELGVESIATAMGCSTRQLLRAFRVGCNRTVAGYVRARRMEAGSRLLRNTNLPIRWIAVAVGIPDAHVFNKCVWREIGMSPNMVRALGPGGSGRGS
jgi:AraC family transcriptional regulator